MFKNALVSVSNKRALDTFLSPLAKQGMRIVSSGGTAQFLQDQNLQVTKVSEQTGYPEVMGGRVKTLHPRIHMPLLCRHDQDEDKVLLKKEGLLPFDLVVVNLYPFEQALIEDKSYEEMIEFIDIGGPTLLRAAAKNHQNIVVVCDPDDYAWILEKKDLDLEDRKKLAAKVFRHVSRYDEMIAQYLEKPNDKDLNITAHFHRHLRYGENPQQSAQWLSLDSKGLHRAQVVQGKELSYNNILDLSAAIETLALFDEPAAVAVKHNNPCGVAQAQTIERAFEMALKADPVSVFGGIVAVNRTLDLSTAEKIQSLFIECVIAPSVTSEALALIAKKKNLRLLIWEDMMTTLQTSAQNQLRSVAGGLLMQSQDHVQSRNQDWQLVCGQLEEKDWLGLEFSWKVCSSLKSNAISITNHQQTLGLGMGQVNRVDAIKQALQRIEQFHPQETRLYLASDAFFPFSDSIELAHKGNITAIIQPGGSVRDKEVIAKAKELCIPMVLTGRRHFRH